jgi:hypothetical protein
MKPGLDLLYLNNLLALPTATATPLIHDEDLPYINVELTSQSNCSQFGVLDVGKEKGKNGKQSSPPSIYYVDRRTFHVIN